MGVTIGALLPIANPFSTAPVFIALTRGYDRATRLRQARLAAVYMACVLLVSLFAGALILKFFGISLPALRIAGGLIVARIGFSMLTPEPERPLPKRDQEESADKDAIAFSPIAMPLLSGPGSIAVTISMATAADSLWDHVPISCGIVIVAAISWVVLRFSVKIIDAMGRTGVNALTRLMGLILVCIGVQFIATGIVDLLADNNIIDVINGAQS
jgi:multiple antibiotic resistance protein